MTQQSSHPDWYSVQVDTLRLGISLALFLAVTVGGWLGFQFWNEQRVERHASQVVASARSLSQQLRQEEDWRAAHEEAYSRAVQRLTEAEAALDQEDFRSATSAGEQSYQLLSDIREQILNRGQPGIAWFVSVEGDVQYRRGESGPFRRAEPRDFLYEGDYVRSAGTASAEIFFHYDETRFTIRPGTFFKVASGTRDRSGNLGFMEYGWVDLDTSQNRSGVSTRNSEVVVGGNSRASISLGQDDDRSDVQVDTGSARVRSTATGEEVELGERQKVSLAGAEIGEVVELPPAPRPLEPIDNISIDIDQTREIQLRWSPVEMADRYALQVSRSRLFGDTIIDTSQRRSTAATLGLLGEGTYVWRVAAIDPDGQQGGWSESRRFRVSSFRGLALEVDDTAPPLEVDVRMSGNIAIVRGRTEPGARVELDGDELPVSADGAFSTTASVYGFGAQVLRFRAIDAVGNFTEVKQRVVLPD